MTDISITSAPFDMSKIFLTGFMGTGKSSVGQALADRLGLPFIDLDERIVAAAGEQITDIFASKGESHFRALEHAALEEVCCGSASVVSTGGGAVIRPDNRQLMRECGVVANLRASAETIENRLRGDEKRPLLRDDKSVGKLAAMLEEREVFYADADVRIDTTGKAVEEIVEEILVWLKTSIGKGDGVVEFLTVGLGERSYRIHFGSDVLSQLGHLCRELQIGSRVAVVTNTTVGPLYRDRVEKSLDAAGFRVSCIEIPDGEEYKTTATLNLIYDELIDNGIDRGSFIVALGGGVVGDIAGFAAASYLRGIPFVQVPTTLLAQVDSSVGGKTGINHPRGKNLIGAFYQPGMVLTDIATLDTLAEREYLCGLAEVVKYGVALDRELFDYIRDHADAILSRDEAALLFVIKRCCALKASVVERDEREGGLRAVLNYGHTMGHAVETLTGYSQFKHGEAVAIGMAQAARYSEAMGFAAASDTAEVIGILQRLGLPVEPPSFSRAQYAEVLFHDKKARDGGVNFVFNKGVGDFQIMRVTDISLLLSVSGIGG